MGLHDCAWEHERVVKVLETFPVSSSLCIAAIPEFDDQVGLYPGSFLCMHMEGGNGPNRLINLIGA